MWDGQAFTGTAADACSGLYRQSSQREGAFSCAQNAMREPRVFCSSPIEQALFFETT
jgi:hypothetical protein